MIDTESLDLFDVASVLTEDERLVRDTVRRFVDKKVLPVIGQAFAEHRFPSELVPAIAELGLLGATLDGYGGSGLSYTAYGVINEELERGDSALRSFASVQSSLVMGCIAEFGSDEQRERWLPPMVKGEIIGCFGLTEAQGGSDPGRMNTHASRSGGDWILNGSKVWITNGTIADVAVVWARVEDGIGAFLVESSMPGFDAREIEDKFSLRASSTAELFFHDVRLPESSRLPLAEGLKSALASLNHARYGIAWGACGAARACLEEAIAYVSDRTLFGRSLAKTQTIQIRLADAARRLSTAQLLALRLGQLKDAGKVTSYQVSLAKWNNTRMALDIARDCRDMLGGAGITVEHQAIRHMLNLESVITYEGTEESAF
jgi:glutaryl-CoA dehydrogenase